MIRLEKVNKYFNRYKRNQIHVINDTTLNFSSSGLVAILGPSGCGKTTLLNVIGGLDKVSNGSIYISGNKITKRKVKKIDKIRNLNIGYIFQDYKLVDNLSVYDNVALSLKLVGIKDKDEIDKRVMYTLDAVNMARYKNRPANMLSGGEKQRVGIARALVKNPKIILADEPTGNLDSKNSIEIMNIIKNISNKYLVILVTHEEELARFYATDIVELKDGVVEKVYKNDNVSTLNYRIDNHIYLKDYKQIDNLKKDKINIDVYRDNKEEIDIKIVFKNGSIYIENNTNDKIEVIDNNSSISLIDDHYKEIEEIKETNFDIENISSNQKMKYSSILKLGSFVKYGFKKLLDYPIFKKILLGGFFLSGMFIFYSIASIFATINIEDKDFITVNKNYLNVNTPSLTVDSYLSYEKLNDINYIIPSNSIVNFRFNYDKYLQTFDSSGNISGSLSSIDEINSNDLFLGRMPVNDYEIVIDKMTLETFIKREDTKTAGFFTIEDYLNHEVYLDNMNSFIIVGISDIEEPNIYCNKSLFMNILANSIKEDYYDTYEITKIIDYTLVTDKVKLIKGKYPQNDYEVLINSNYQYEYNINDKLNLKVNNQKLKIVGFYEQINNNNDLDEAYLVNNNMIKYNLIENAKEISINSGDKDSVINYFRDLKMNIKDSYDYDKNNYLESHKNSIISTLTISLFILAISLIEILLMVRSSFLSRIKEVGIYRAIGLKKSDIYKMFAGEVLAITTLFSVTGILFMSYILYCLCHIELLKNMFMVNIFTIVISFFLVYLFNLIVGLIPVYNTIRKTPASILARNDID